MHLSTTARGICIVARVDKTEPMTQVEHEVWLEAITALRKLKTLHTERTGHTVWLQCRRWDVGLRCFSGCDVL